MNLDPPGPFSPVRRGLLLTLMASFFIVGVVVLLFGGDSSELLTYYMFAIYPLGIVAYLLLHGIDLSLTYLKA